MNFTALKFEPHTILKAYAVLFGQMPQGAMLFLDRKRLKQQWEARAKGIARSVKGGWPPGHSSEDTLDFEELDWAYRLLLELLGSRDQTIVAGWTSENIEAVNAVLKKSRTLSPVRRRQTPAAKAPSIKTGAAVATQKMRRSTDSAVASSAGIGAAVAPRAVQPPPLPAVSNGATSPRLMFGRFLLSKGHITLQQLIDAVRWQRAQRPPVGRIAMNCGILSATQVYEVLSAKNPDDRFCDVAVRKGFMTGCQRQDVLDRQRSMQKRIGAYFVEQGILTHDEIEGLAAEARR